MNTVGPVYCETLHISAGSVFPFEMVNTLTSFIPALLGLIALFVVHRKNRKSYELYILSLLLLATGIGSVFWHGTRTSLSLSFDVFPGMFFFLLLVFLWPNFLFKSKIAGFGVIALFLLLVTGLFQFGSFQDTIHPFFYVYGTVAFIGTILSLYTWKKKGNATGTLAFLTIASATLAAFFRTIDLSMCTVIPFGTHFLWHIFLGTAGFLGILLILAISKNPDQRRV